MFIHSRNKNCYVSDISTFYSHRHVQIFIYPLLSDYSNLIRAEIATNRWTGCVFESINIFSLLYTDFFFHSRPNRILNCECLSVWLKTCYAFSPYEKSNIIQIDWLYWIWYFFVKVYLFVCDAFIYNLRWMDSNVNVSPFSAPFCNFEN